MGAGKAVLAIIGGTFAVVMLFAFLNPDGGPTPGGATPAPVPSPPVVNGQRLVGIESAAPSCVDTRPSAPGGDAFMATLSATQRARIERDTVKVAKTSCDLAFATYMQPVAARLCVDAIKTGLNDPNSAKFPMYADIEVTTHDRTNYVARLQLRAKNAFGAYILTDAECELRRDVATKSLVAVSYRVR